MRAITLRGGIVRQILKAAHWAGRGVVHRRSGETLSARRYQKRVQVIKKLCGTGKKVRCMCKGCRVSGMRYIGVLTIDHVDGDGAKHKSKNGKRMKGHQLILYIVRKGYPKGFTVLCANCNFARSNRGYCPLIGERH